LRRRLGLGHAPDLPDQPRERLRLQPRRLLLRGCPTVGQLPRHPLERGHQRVPRRWVRLHDTAAHPAATDAAPPPTSLTTVAASAAAGAGPDGVEEIRHSLRWAAATATTAPAAPAASRASEVDASRVPAWP